MMFQTTFLTVDGVMIRSSVKITNQDLSENDYFFFIYLQVDADRAGLVPTHAYAVLDVREVLGTKLFMLKNPWAQLRWKGNFSELDKVHWTPEMKAALKFDPNSAKMFDNGVFWIDYASILKFFDVFYLSWNPKMFSHTYCIHKWDCFHVLLRFCPFEPQKEMSRDCSKIYAELNFEFFGDVQCSTPLLDPVEDPRGSSNYQLWRSSRILSLSTLKILEDPLNHDTVSLDPRGSSQPWYCIFRSSRIFSIWI